MYVGDGEMGRWGKIVPCRENSVSREWRRQWFMLDHEVCAFMG